MTILFWLFTKHFVVDFPLQATPWMYRNKGTYGHPGGLVHAGLHLVFTWLALTICDVGQGAALVAAVFDGVVHYHVDWAKVQVTTHFALTPINSEWFWQALGFDQYLHALTYFAIVWWFV